MKQNKVPEISVDEIMKKIEEEIAKKRIPHDSAFRSGLDPARPDSEGGMHSAAPITPEAPERGTVSGILWTYGTRYAKLIKKIPGLNRIAEHYYWELADMRRPLARITAAPSAGYDILPTNLNYAGFIEGLKHEGLKGRIKWRIFTFIGFFGWWQGQVNSALYEKLAEQEAQVAELEARLADRDGVVKELSRKLSVLSRLEDAIYEELTVQRAEIARQRGLLAHSADSRADQN